jgi:hypothetical protein
MHDHAVWKVALILFIFLIQMSCMKQVERINLSSDIRRTKEEIIKLIPVGSSIKSAQEVMQKNGFNCQMMLNRPFAEMDESGTNNIYRKIDFLYCDRQGFGIVCRPRWQVAIVQNNAVVKDVFVSYGRVCL